MTFSEESFWDKIKDPDSRGCMEWGGYANRGGYGVISNGPTNLLTHRVAYFLVKGEIPEDKVVHHTCYNRRCCNPEHLGLLTRSQNSKDNDQSRRTHCPHGHEYSEENTHINKHTGGRVCRMCKRAGDTRRRAAKRNGQVG